MMKSKFCVSPQPLRGPHAAEQTTSGCQEHYDVGSSCPGGRSRQILLVAAGVSRSRAACCSRCSRGPSTTRGGSGSSPASKVDPGETLEKALARELDEELAVKVEETDLEPIAFTSHPLRRLRKSRGCRSTACWPGAGDPVGAEGRPLAWVTSEELG